MWYPELKILHNISQITQLSLRFTPVETDTLTNIGQQQGKANVLGMNSTVNKSCCPFQDLSVTLMSDRPTSEIQMEDDPDEVHKLYKQSFIDEQVQPHKSDQYHS